MHVMIQSVNIVLIPYTQGVLTHPTEFLDLVNQSRPKYLFRQTPHVETERL